MAQSSKIGLLLAGFAVALAAIVVFVPELMIGPFALITMTMLAFAFLFAALKIVQPGQSDGSSKQKRVKPAGISDAELDQLVARLDDEQAERLLERLQQRDRERVISLDEALGLSTDAPERQEEAGQPATRPSEL